MSLQFDDLPLLKLPDEPTEVVLTRDTRFDGEDLDRFIERGGVVRNTGYRVFVDGTVSFDTLNALVLVHAVPNGGIGTVLLVRAWRLGDRIRVLRGEHEGRTGTVNMLPSSPYAQCVKLGVDQFQIALDGEPGGVSVGPNARAAGGRGGRPIVIASNDIEPYDGPAGVALGKDRR
jgi:hypothetical protein